MSRNRRASSVASSSSSTTTALPTAEQWAKSGLVEQIPELLRFSDVFKADESTNIDEDNEGEERLPIAVRSAGVLALPAIKAKGARQQAKAREETDENIEKPYMLVCSSTDRKLRLISTTDLSVERWWTLPAGFSLNHFAIINSDTTATATPVHQSDSASSLHRHAAQQHQLPLHLQQQQQQQRRRLAKESLISCVGVQHGRLLWQWNINADALATDAVDNRSTALPQNATELYWFSCYSSSLSSSSAASLASSDSDSDETDSLIPDDEDEGVLVVVMEEGTVGIYSPDLKPVLFSDLLASAPNGHVTVTTSPDSTSTGPATRRQQKKAGSKSSEVVGSRFVRVNGTHGRLILLVNSTETTATPSKKTAASATVVQHFVSVDIRFNRITHRRAASSSAVSQERVSLADLQQVPVSGLLHTETNGKKATAATLTDWRVTSNGQKLTAVLSDSTWLVYDFASQRVIHRNTLTYLDTFKRQYLKIVPLSSSANAIALIGYPIAGVPASNSTSKTASEQNNASWLSLTVWNTVYGTCVANYRVSLSWQSSQTNFSAVQLGHEVIAVSLDDRVVSVELPTKTYSTSSLIGILGSAITTRHLLAAHAPAAPATTATTAGLPCSIPFPLSTLLLSRERQLDRKVPQPAGPYIFAVPSPCLDGLTQQEQAFRRIANATSPSEFRRALFEYLFAFVHLSKDYLSFLRSAAEAASLPVPADDENKRVQRSTLSYALTELVVRACCYRVQQADDGEENEAAIWWETLSAFLEIARPSARMYPQIIDSILKHTQLALLRNVLTKQLLRDIPEDQLCQILVFVLSADVERKKALTSYLRPDIARYHQIIGAEDDDHGGDPLENTKAQRLLRRAQQIFVSLVVVQPWSPVLLTQAMSASLDGDRAYHLLVVLHRILFFHSQFRVTEKIFVPDLESTLTWVGVLFDAFATQLIAQEAHATRLRRLHNTVEHFERELQNLQSLRSVLDVFVYHQPMPTETPTFQIQLITL